MTSDGNTELMVVSIIRMSIHNGPGFRTLVLMKGCPLVCLWCSTPESQSPDFEIGFDEQKCIACSKCVFECMKKGITLREEKPVINREICVSCASCTQKCNSKAIYRIGKKYKNSEMLHELLKDRVFYKNSGGGIVFSGGEPLIQADKIMWLLEELSKEKISVAFDTTGHVNKKIIEGVLTYTDFFLWDIKHMDTVEHKKLTGVGNDLILSNLVFVSNKGIPVYLRYPMIPGLNDSDDNLRTLCEFATTLKSLVRLDLLPIHHLGRVRYRNLGRKYPLEGYQLISDDVMKKRKEIVESYGLKCTIGG